MSATATTEQVIISGRTFEVIRGDNGYIALKGARGAEYFLRGFTGVDTGVREVISWKSGAALRDKAYRNVRVIEIAGIIEELTR